MQLVWYLVVVILYYVRKVEWALTISLRYIDWLITTPLMIFTLNLLILYWKVWKQTCPHYCTLASVAAFG